MTYRPLFLLEADTAFIFEIKRLDVQSDNPGDVYFWLYFDKTTQKLYPLTFISMQAAGDEQQRTFEQGRLQFTSSEGTYAPHNGVAVALRPVAPALPAEVEAAVHSHFPAS